MNFDKIFYWLLVLFILYLVVEVVRKILGGSLGFEEAMVALLVANLGLSFRMNSKLSGHLGWHKGKEEVNKTEQSQ